jgi:hypothetical protein
MILKVLTAVETCAKEQYRLSKGVVLDYRDNRRDYDDIKRTRDLHGSAGA